MKKIVIVIGICILLAGIPSTTAILTQSMNNLKTQFPNNDKPILTIDTPPDWATCSFIGVLGVTDQMGKPLPPSHAVAGYCQDNFNGRLVGAIAELNEKEPVGYIGAHIIGPFLLGIMGISNEKKTFIIGIGGRNETHFYFRTMAIVGPTFYITGLYLPLQ